MSCPHLECLNLIKETNRTPSFEWNHLLVVTAPYRTKCRIEISYTLFIILYSDICTWQTIEHSTREHLLQTGWPLCRSNISVWNAHRRSGAGRFLNFILAAVIKLLWCHEISSVTTARNRSRLQTSDVKLGRSRFLHEVKTVCVDYDTFDQKMCFGNNFS